MISNFEHEQAQLLQLDLVDLAMQLQEANKELPIEKRLPQALFTVYRLAVPEWYNMLKKPRILWNFDTWADEFGLRDVELIRHTFELTECQEKIFDEFEAWALAIKWNLEAGKYKGL